MSLIADGLLIVAGLTAGLYCFVLSRRLKAFSSTETGIGQEIRQLNATLAETREALSEAQSSAKAEAEALARDIAHARKLSTQLTNVIAEAERAKANLATPQDTPTERPKSKAADPIGVPAENKAEPEPETPEVAEQAEPANEDQSEAQGEEIESGEINFEDALSGASEEAQLGFMPDAALDELDDDEESPDSDEDLSDLDSQEDPGVLAEGAQDDGDAQDVEDSVAAGATAAAETAENLLKVERMAL